MKLVQYTIDGSGNRSQVQTTPLPPPSQVPYAADVVNQYTQVGGTSRTHDSNGNLTDNGTYKFGYDFENRLVDLRSTSTSALIATYRYDALGRRVEKALSGGATTRYLLDGPQVIEEYDGSDNWQALYVYEDGIDRARCMDRADIADVNGNSNTTEVLRLHYHQQALGCVTELTQPTGAVVGWTIYDVYGQPALLDMNGVSITQSAVGNPYLYTGREYDPESALYFYRARQYDPKTGRFLQRDPAGLDEGPNLYEYVRCAPTLWTDPTGKGVLEIILSVLTHPSPLKEPLVQAVVAATEDLEVEVSINKEALAVEVEVEGKLVSGLSERGATIVTPFCPIIFYFGRGCRSETHSSGLVSLGQHERGHALQYWQDYSWRYMGWLHWWGDIGIPSVWSYEYSRPEDHANRPFEKDATERGKATTDERGP